jgi:hypothetical protein
MRRHFARLAACTLALAVASGSVASAAAPPDLTPDEVCALVETTTVEQVLAVTVDVAEPVTGGTPQCSYAYQDSEGTFTNLSLAVMRSEDDLGGRTGKKAFKYAIQQNRLYAPKGTKFKKVKGVGERAVFVEGSALNLMIIGTADGRVVTITGSLSRNEAAEIGVAAVSGLA